MLHHLGTARWLRTSLKLARQYGVSNVVVIHRLSDLLAAGDADSEQVQLAKGLLSDTETRVIYGQAQGEIGATADLLGLSQSDADDSQRWSGARPSGRSAGAAMWWTTVSVRWKGRSLTPTRAWLLVRRERHEKRPGGDG